MPNLHSTGKHHTASVRPSVEHIGTVTTKVCSPPAILSCQAQCRRTAAGREGSRSEDAQKRKSSPTTVQKKCAWMGTPFAPTCKVRGNLLAVCTFVRLLAWPNPFGTHQEKNHPVCCERCASPNPPGISVDSPWCSLASSVKQKSGKAPPKPCTR